MLYLSSSKVSVVILGNFLFSLTLVFGNLLKKIFLGTLRESEVERLQERSKEAIMETCLAMTIFREEFNVNFVALFVSLLFIKIGHWLAQDRVEYVETTPTVTRLSHMRIITFLALLLVIDGTFLNYSVSFTLTNGPSVLLYFGFEYVILASATISTIVKYIFYAIDMFVDGRWENKGLCVFYLELVTDLLHIFVYLIFFLIIMKYYGFPLHLMRDLYSTIRNFRTRVADFIRYRRITTNMNERFPDATAEELSRSDTVCIICREEMTSAKKLPCGHLFHAQCLRSWLERQQTCPTCRAPVLPTPAPATDPAAPAAPANPPDAAPTPGETQLRGVTLRTSYEVAVAGIASAETKADEASAALTVAQQLVYEAQASPPTTPPSEDFHLKMGQCAQAAVKSADAANLAASFAQGFIDAAELASHPAVARFTRATYQALDSSRQATQVLRTVTSLVPRPGSAGASPSPPVPPESASSSSASSTSPAALLTLSQEITRAAQETQISVREVISALREVTSAGLGRMEAEGTGNADIWGQRGMPPPAGPDITGGSGGGAPAAGGSAEAGPSGVRPSPGSSTSQANPELANPALANWYAAAPNWYGMIPQFAGLPAAMAPQQGAPGAAAPGTQPAGLGGNIPPGQQNQQQEGWNGFPGMMPYPYLPAIMAPPMYMPPPLFPAPGQQQFNLDLNAAPAPAAQVPQPPTSTTTTASASASGSSSATQGGMTPEQQQHHAAASAAAAAATAAVTAMFPVSPFMSTFMQGPTTTASSASSSLPSPAEAQQLLAAVRLLHDRLPALLSILNNQVRNANTSVAQTGTVSEPAATEPCTPVASVPSPSEECVSATHIPEELQSHALPNLDNTVEGMVNEAPSTQTESGSIQSDPPEASFRADTTTSLTESSPAAELRRRRLERFQDKSGADKAEDDS